MHLLLILKDICFRICKFYLNEFLKKYKIIKTLLLKLANLNLLCI